MSIKIIKKDMLNLEDKLFNKGNNISVYELKSKYAKFIN